VTTSTDGFIKVHDAFDGQSVKYYFVCQSGICASTPLGDPTGFALAGEDNNIYIFTFHTGTVMEKFYAHDDLITQVIFKNEYLISCSLDQTIKLWNLT